MNFQGSKQPFQAIGWPFTRLILNGKKMMKIVAPGSISVISSPNKLASLRAIRINNQGFRILVHNRAVNVRLNSAANEPFLDIIHFEGTRFICIILKNWCLLEVEQCLSRYCTRVWWMTGEYMWVLWTCGSDLDQQVVPFSKATLGHQSGFLIHIDHDCQVKNR